MARKKQYRVECAELRRMVPIEKILSHYGVLAGLKRAGSQLAGCCPIHNGSNRKQFVVNLDKNSWRCFGDCDRGGRSSWLPKSSAWISPKRPCGVNFFASFRPSARLGPLAAVEAGHAGMQAAEAEV